MLSLGVVFAIAFVGLVLVDLALGMYVFAVSIYVEAIPALGGAVSVTKMLGVVIALAWLATALRREADRRSLTADHPRLVGFIALFVAWVWLSTLWADDAGVVPGTVLRFALNFSLLPILYMALRTPRNAQVLIVCMIGGALLSVVMGVVDPSAAPAGPDRLTGNGFNSNELGLFMVAAAPLAATLATTRAFSGGTRLLLAMASLSCLLALFTTGSRESLVGLLVAMLVGTMFAGPGRRALALPLAATALLCAVTYFAVLAPPGLREHVSSTTGSGREDIWRVGGRMVRANPVLGVGAGNYTISAKHYLVEPGLVRRQEFIIDNPKQAHNIYLHVLAELGVVGLGIFLAIVAALLACVVRAARLFARRGDTAMEIICRGMFPTLCGVLAASFFASQLYSKPLWILLALCPALLAIARSPGPIRRTT